MFKTAVYAPVDTFVDTLRFPASAPRPQRGARPPEHVGDPFALGGADFSSWKAALTASSSRSGDCTIGEVGTSRASPVCS